MISIVIINYNSGTALEKCLNSVIQNTVSSFELLLTDNASNDLSATFANGFEFPQLIKRFNRNNLGFPQAFNQAVRQARNDIILGLDDDTVVPPGWDQGLLAFLNPDTALVGAKIVYPDERIFCAEYGIVPLGLVGWGELDLGQRDYQRQVDALANTAIAINKKAFLEVNGYDENFFPCQYEDIDLCLRLRKRGYKIVYNGQVKIIHDNLFRSLNREQHNEQLLQDKHYAFEHYPMKDSHQVEQLRAFAQKALVQKNYEKAYDLFRELYQSEKYPAEPAFFQVLLRLKKYDELNVFYRRRTTFFPKKSRRDAADTNQ